MHFTVHLIVPDIAITLQAIAANAK